MQTSHPSKTRPSRRRFRNALAILAVAAIVAVAHSREFPSVPYAAMPEKSVVACDNFSVRSRWRDVVALPAVSNLLEAADVDVAELRDAPGWRILIPLTTGRNTVLAVTQPDEVGGDPILYGASHSGWRRLVLLFLLKTRWIPGLGRLEIAPCGSRYLPLGTERHPSDLKVGFAMRKNVLLAALSTDGDAVRELEQRIDKDASPSSVFGGRRPWESRNRALHRVWIRDNQFGSSPELRVLELTRDGFAADGDIMLRGQSAEWLASAGRLTGRNAKASALDADGAIAVLALPGGSAATQIKGLLDINAPLLESAAKEDAVAYLTGAPCGGSIFGIRIPALTILCPGLALSKDDVTRAVGLVADGGKYPQVQSPVDEGTSLLVPLRWQKGNAVFKTYPEENGVFELDRRNHGLTFCSSMASFKAQRAASTSESAPWREWFEVNAAKDEGNTPVGYFWVDFARLADECRQMLALSRMATMLGLVRLDADDRSIIEATDRFLATFTSPCRVALLLSRSPDGTSASMRMAAY